MKKNRPFGYSSHLDCYNCSIPHLDDKGHCEQFLETMVKKLRVHKQAPVSVIRTPQEFQDKAGLSGNVMLVESNITIHTLTVTGFAWIDVCCCREFDRQVVKDVIKDFFLCRDEDIEERFLLRGTTYYNRLK